MRRLWFGLGILFVLLVAGVIGLNLWAHAYLRSAAFRQLVSAKTGQALKVDAEYQPFDWSGSSVFSESLKGLGESGAPLESIDAEQVRANVDWRAIFEGAWRVDRIEVVRLDAKIRDVGRQDASAREPGPGPTPEPVPSRHSLLPSRFELGRISVQDANLEVGTIAKVHNTALAVQREGEGWVFDGTGGKLNIFNREPCAIDSFRVRLQQRVVYLTNASLHLGAAGTFTVSGEIGGPVAPFDLQLEWQNVAAADLLDSQWKDRLTGTLSGKAHSVGRVNAPPLTTGSFLLADGQLEGLPVQKEIAKFTRSPQFERMPLQQVSGDFSYDGAKTEVKNFVAESQGLLRLEGNCRIGDDGSLKGKFRVGVTSQSLQWLPGSQEKVFTTSENGYLWTTVKIGGTLQKPSEDLSDRLARAMGEQAIDTGLQLLQQAPTNATDAVDKALDILSPLIH